MSITRPIERVPPQNLEAEQSVLGSMLLDRDAIARVVEALRPEDFYRDLHRTIFQAMLELFERGEPVDLITVTNNLATVGKLEDVGGATYLASLPNTVPTAANAEFYADIVLEKSILRALISAGTHIASLGYEGMDEVSALIDQAEKLVYGIAARRNVQDFQTIKEILKSSFEKIDKRYQEKGTVTGVATGFTDLDTMTSGLQPADMVIIAARPSVGKCLSENSEIVLEDGSIATIGEIYRRRRARLLTLGSDWKLRVTEPSAFVDDGFKPAFRVRTRLGRTVTCTAIHPFLTASGWLPLASLRVGDRIAVPRRIAVFGREPLQQYEIKLLAYLVDDSARARRSLASRRGAPGIVNDFAAAVEAVGAVHWRPRPRNRRCAGMPDDPADRHRRGTRLFMRWLVEHGPSDEDLRSNEIPAPVFRLPREQLSLFLNRLFAAAWRSRRPPASKLTRIAYPTKSLTLARQVQHLLLRFGVIARLRPSGAADDRSQRRAWQLQIADPESIETFSREIGIFGHAKQLASVLAAARRKRAMAKAGFVPIAAPRSDPRAQEPDAPQRSPISEGDIYWDEIASIEHSGNQHVYDLMIPDTHNFVANDICVHNTTLSLNIAQHAAITDKMPVAIFSLETSKEQLVQRILCSEARVDNSKLRTGYLADEDWRKLARAMGSLSEAPIFIDDSASLSVMEMRAKARKLKAEHGLGLIVIDYIQMIQSFKRTENRTQELSEIARGIKSLAKELDIPIIAVSQLSRAVESLGSRRPMLSHLRECVTGDTVVWDADTGQRHTVADLARAESWPRLLSLDRRGKLVPVRPAAVIEKGVNDVFEIRTSTGRRLRATANHPILTPLGWKTVGELQPRAVVAAARCFPVFCAHQGLLTNHRLRLLGYLIGDGSYQRHRGISFISADPLTFEDCIALATSEFGVLARRGQANGTLEVHFAAVYPQNGSTGRAYGRPHGNPLREWLRELGVEGQSSYDKRIPATNDLLWDRIASITPVGKAPVYDLCMPDTHNFVANGLIAHNSGELEQTSDLVVFLYREDYYDAEKAQRENKENVCELIIAKHRNGPIGQVELYFHKEFSRFENLSRRR